MAVCIAAHCLSFLKQKVAVPVALVLVSVFSWHLGGGHFNDYFDSKSAILPFFVLSKPLAKDVSGVFVPGDVIAVTDFGIYNGLNWYLDQFVAHNPFTAQNVSKDSGSITLKYLSGLGHFGGLAKNESEFIGKMGQPDGVFELPQAKVYSFTIARKPGLVFEALPGKVVLRADLRDFYAKTDIIRDLTYDGNWGGAFCPTGPGRKSIAQFHVDNKCAPGPQLLTVGLRYVNEGKGNALRVYCRFDDENEWVAFTSNGPDSSIMDLAIVERREPYSKLTIRCELELASLTARFPGGNQETLGIRELFVNTEALQ